MAIRKNHPFVLGLVTYAALATTACGPGLATFADDPTAEDTTTGIPSTADSSSPANPGDSGTGQATPPATSSTDDDTTTASDETTTDPSDDGLSTTTSSQPGSTSNNSSTSTDPSTTDQASTGPANPCGDGFLDPGEECDDGNTTDTDACTSSCTTAVCGDGIIWLTEEECDDANLDEADACTNTCTERFPFIYVTILEEHYDMWRYSAEDDSWETLTGPGDYHNGLAWDGTYLHIAEWGAEIYRYDPSTDVWSFELHNPIGWFDNTSQLVWTDDGLYLFSDVLFGPTEIYVNRDGGWTQLPIDHDISIAGSWDPVAHELYIRDYGELGFIVLDTTTDTIVREVTNNGLSNEANRVGTYLDGLLYSQMADEPIVGLDAYTALPMTEEVAPSSLINAAAADPYKNQIYLVGYGPWVNHLERYDVEDATITPLAPMPTDPYPGFQGQPSIALVYPEP